MTPAELWEKYSTPVGIGCSNILCHDDFLAALAEYGAAVRGRDKEICEECQTDGPSRANFMALKCAAAIEREPLP